MSFIQNLFGWRSGAGKTTATTPPPAYAPVLKRRKTAPEPESLPLSMPPEPAASPQDCVAFPLKVITDLFPPELSAAIRKQPSEHVEIQIPRAIVQAQLATGAVRLTFAQLRAATPEIFFHPDGAPPDTRFLLPLNAVLQRMTPSRRDDQREVSVPLNIPSIFSKAGAGQQRSASGTADPWYSQRRPMYEAPDPDITPSNGQKSEAPQHEQPQHIPEPVAPPIAAAPIAPEPPAPIAAAPIAPAPTAPIAAAPVAPTPPVAAPVSAVPVASATSDSVAVALAMVLPMLPPEVRHALYGCDPATESFLIPLAEFEKRMRSGKLLFKWSELRGWCKSEVSASIDTDVDVELPLAALVPLFMAARKSPQTRKKIEVDSSIPDVFGKSNLPATPEPVPDPVPAPLPAAAPIAPALRIESPAPAAAPEPAPAAPPVPSPEPAPIPAAAPIVSALRVESPAPATTPETAAVAPPVSTPEPDPIPAEATAAPTFRVEQSPLPPPIAVEQPAPGPTAPAQILQRIRALDGVVGAFLATSDGLLIAADLPDGNENILAAFAPTVFSQLTKYTEMARLGLPESVDLHLGIASLHVQKAGKIFVGVLTPRGHPLRLAELDHISAALQPHAP